MSSHYPDPRMAEMIARNRRIDEAKKHDLALMNFYMAITSCHCSYSIRQTCGCKNSNKVVALGGSIIAREAMELCHCELSRQFGNSKCCHCVLSRYSGNGKCDNVHHLEALDGRAATFEAMGEFDLAKNEAEWILEMAPQLPDGYLRLGNIAQLQQNDDFAWEIYTTGIEAVEETTMDSSPKLQQLYDARESVKRHVFRQDLLCLPAEIVTQIFSYLECDEISRCLRVSKNWACTLTSPVHARLWRDMQFSDRSEYPGLENLKRMLSWAGKRGARKFVTLEDMVLTQSMLTLLLDESTCLEYLKIWKLPDKILFPTDGKTWDQLRHFSLGFGCYGSYDDNDIDGPGGFPCTFLQDAASSLEHLDFLGIPAECHDNEPFIPFLPKLKTLHIDDQGHSPRHDLSLPIYPLSVAFPRLEQLYIGPFVPLFDPEPVSIWRDKRNDIWPHLKVLIVEVEDVERPGPAAARMRSAVRNLTCINRGNSLQHIRFEFRYGWPDMDIFSGSDDLLPDFDIVQDSDFQNLQSFRSTSLSISPEGARNLLSKAMQTEQLTSFDIVFPLEFDERNHRFLPISGYVEEWHADHLRGYDWTRGAPSIQSLGCYGLCIHPPTDFNQGHVVAEFLATFPNLRTLSMECKYHNVADYASFLIEILRVTHLETMYLNGSYIHREACAQLRQAALDQGVQLMQNPSGFEDYPPSRDWRFSLGGVTG
ncbi:hypothetical protein E4U11_005766 [Claviceps purpurea]|nr:hypothetical protein E4U11_005766 [Claviceps purpurea]